MKALSIVACASAALALTACGNTTSTGSGGGHTTTQTADPPPAFDPGSVQTRNEINYPEGPYGVNVGSVIPNMAFIGFVNAVADSANTQTIHLGDFYNKHGRDTSYVPASAAEDDRLFPPGSQYGEGKPKPTVLTIDVASVWCGPCNLEAKCNLPVIERRYAPCGGGFFLQLQDGATPGKAATIKNLVNWTAKSYKEDFPTAIDPEERIINSIAPQQAFPVNLLVDTTTMKIVEAIAGVPDASYWKKYEKLLLDPTCPADKGQCATDADCAAFPNTHCSTTCPANPITCMVHGCQPLSCQSQ